MIGKEIGNHRILKELGKGGMGVVYKAHQLSLGRSVAMKVLPRRLTSDSSFIKRFHNEARAIAKLNHPNIVQIYDIGQEDDIHYYTMEFIEGPTLDDIIYKEGFLAPDRAAAIITQVSKALQYSHSHGIVHRDIKPSNIMITKSGQVKVTDFGLALQRRATRLTVDGSIVGTPEYMSPEQASGRTATTQSDIYSLGVVAYELLTGKAPFEGDSPLLILNKIQNSEPQWPRSIDPNIPVDLENIVRKMMARNLSDRYTSCQEIIQDMRKLKSGQPVLLQRERSLTFRRIAGAVAGVSVAAAVILGAAYAFRGIGSDDDKPVDPPTQTRLETGAGNSEISALPASETAPAKAPDAESENAEEAAGAPLLGEEPEATAPESTTARLNAWDIPDLEGPADIAQALAIMEEKLSAISRRRSGGEWERVEDDFNFLKGRFDLVKERMEAFNPVMHPDIIALKRGKKRAEEMSVRITGESLANVRIVTASLRRSQPIPRNQLLYTVYAEEKDGRLADELLQTKKRVDKFSKKVSQFQNTLNPSPRKKRAEPAETQAGDESGAIDENLEIEEDDEIDTRRQEEPGDWGDDTIKEEPEEEYADETDFFAD